MIKAILFDLYGTLTNGKCDPEKKIIKHFKLKRNYDYVEDFVCGHKFKNQSEYLESIILGLNLSNTKETRLKLIRIFSSEVKKEYLLKGMISQVKRLKKQGFTIGLISNAPNPGFDLIRRNKLKFFDHLTYSFEVGITKPDEKIFKLALSKMKVKPREVLMVGNSMNSDIRPANKLGMDAIHFTNSSNFKKELKKKLQNHL